MTDPKADMRAETLARFSEATNAPAMVRIIQRGRDPQTARFTASLVDGREVKLGTIATLWSQTELAKVLAVACGVVLERVKPGEWQAILSMLVRYCVDVEEVEGEGFEDTVREWLVDYLDVAALGTDRAAAAVHGMPFTENGEIYVTAQHLAKYVRREHSEQVSLADLRAALADLGFERRTVMYQRTKKRSSRSYYVVSDGLLNLNHDDGAADDSTASAAGSAA